MTIEAGTTIETLLGDGVNKVFPYSFPVLSADHILVRVYDTVAGTYSTISAANYDITGVGTYDGGEVTYPKSGSPDPAIAATKKMVLSLQVPLTQTLDINNQGGFNASLLETQLDRMVLMEQQMATEVLRTVQVPAADDPSSPMILPDEATRKNSGAGRIAAFDGTTGAIIGSTVTPDQLEALDGTRAEAAQTAAEAAAALTAADVISTNADAAATAADRIQTGLDAAAAALSETNAAASEANALASRLAAAGYVSNLTGPFFPSTAAALGIGLRAVTITGAGSGGTNGTYPCGTTGGTTVGGADAEYLITVAGNVVVAAVRQSPGHFSVAPTGINTSGIPGLSGATFALTTGANVADGEYFSIPVSEAFVARYRVASGVAIFDKNLPLKERLQDRIKAVTKGKAKLLVTADCPHTFRSGSATEIDRLDPLIVPAVGDYLGQPATTFNSATYGGPSPWPERPVFDAGSIAFRCHNGFVLKNSGGTEIGLLDQTKPWAVDIIFDMPPLAGTFTTKAAADAAVASYNNGDIIEVTADGPNIPPGGYPAVPNEAYHTLVAQTAECKQGYYQKLWTGWSILGATSGFLYHETISGSHTTNFNRMGLEPRGFAYHRLYAGSGVLNDAKVYGAENNIVALALQGLVHLSLIFDGTETVVKINGQEVGGDPNGYTAFVSNRFGLNGRATGTNYQTFDGLAWNMHAFLVTQELSYREAVQASNALAQWFGTPVREIPDTAWLIVNIDQSRTSGVSSPTTTPSVPDPITNWDFTISKSISTDSRLHHPSQRPLPNTFTTRNSTETEIGVCFVGTNPYGVVDGSVSFIQATGGNAETIEWGLRAQLDKYMPGGTDAHLYIAGNQAGGFSLDQLIEEDAGTYFNALVGKTLTKPRSKLYRKIALMANRCRRRGQQLVPICIMQVQGETRSYVVGDRPTIGTNHEADFRELVENIEAICGRNGARPICMKKTIVYPTDGGLGGALGNYYNAIVPASNIYDDDNQFYRIKENQDAVLRYTIWPSTYAICGRGIHWPFILIRHMAMGMGEKVGLGYFLGQDVSPFDYTAEISGTNVIIRFDETPEAVEFAYPFVNGYWKTDGIGGVGHLTYGFIFNGLVSGNSQSGDAVLDTGAKTLTIPISGSGPAVGDLICSTGAEGSQVSYYTNIRRATDVIGELKTQAWPSVPFASTSPTMDFTADAHLEDWVVVKRVTLGASAVR